MSRESRTVFRNPRQRIPSPSKADMAEGYLFGTVVVINAVMVGRLLSIGPGSLIELPLWFGPGAALLGLVVWLRRIDLEGEQLWGCAQCAALGIGLGIVVLLGVSAGVRPLSVSGSDTFRVGATVSTLGMVGVLAGTTREVYRSNRDLDLRNRVLRRMLRHDLRNDMTVVLFLLNELESSVGEKHREDVEEIKRKIHTVVDLSDTVRKIDLSTGNGTGSVVRLDLAAVVRHRVSILQSAHPEVDIETDLPDSAEAIVDPDFGVVVDSVVDSVVSGTSDTPYIRIDLTVDTATVVLSFADENGSIPEADVDAVARCSESDLEHARGVDLWLVRWLVDASDGDLRLDADDGRIEIRLDRPPAGGVGTDFLSRLRQ